MGRAGVDVPFLFEFMQFMCCGNVVYIVVAKFVLPSPLLIVHATCIDIEMQCRWLTFDCQRE
jgi:hypothetical protein